MAQAARTAVASGAPGWDLELSDEIVRWYVRLGARDRAYADRALDRLASTGRGLQMPRSRALGGGLHELRFTCEGVSRRITYAFGAGREVTMLTTFRKERGRERHEIGRARRELVRAKAAERDVERSR
ncbi:MAG: type II toxin-antitoxin system RelE/ParE family toxin [Acidimicrobiales bacterium]